MPKLKPSLNFRHLDTCVNIYRDGTYVGKFELLFTYGFTPENCLFSQTEMNQIIKKLRELNKSLKEERRAAGNKS